MNTFPRWRVVLGAILIQLCLGAIYAWSVFTPELRQAGWTNTQTQLVFAAGLLMFAVVMVLAGRWMPALGPRKLALLGGAVLGSGYILGSFSPFNFYWLFTSVGLIGGAGIGLGYVVPIAVGVRWFPDKKGLITGLAVAGFGFGAMLWVKLAGSWGGLLAGVGLSKTLFIYGVAFFVLCAIGATWMVFPPEGYAPASAKAPSSPAWSGGKDMLAGEMLATPQFYMTFACFAAGAGAGLMTIGLMKLFPKEALLGAGYSPGMASAVAGTAMAVFFSLANGIGRIAWGWISDRMGRKPAVVVMLLTQGLVILAFPVLASQPAMLYAASAAIGFNFGGNFALFPTMTSDLFGSKNLAQNYGWVFLAYGFGGVVGPIVGGRLGDVGNFPLAFTLCGSLCLAAAVVAFALQPPLIKESEEEAMEAAAA